MIRMRNPEFLGSLSQINTDWAQRVVNNGGPRPSTSTIIAMETFRQGVVDAGLAPKMRSVCVFVPDSLIAALTPIFKTIGNDPWTNNNFVDADLNVHGLKGNGSTKYLNTGVRATSGQAYEAGTGNCGLTEIVTEQGPQAEYPIDMGHRDTAQRMLALAPSSLVNSVEGRSIFWSFTTATVTECWTTDWNRASYISGNNIAGVSTMYTKSPLTPHAQLFTLARSTNPTTETTTLYGFAFNDRFAVGGANQFSSRRISVMAIHYGLTISESATFATLLLALRTSLGGGTGDEIEAWAARAVTLGSTAPSSNTKTALRTFYSGLVTDSLLSKMVAVNCVVPDNLIAARLPLIWRAGLQIWTNNNFVSGDLTVNGLIGDGSTKWLNTGMIASNAIQTPNVTGWSDTSAGTTFVMFTNPGTQNASILRVAGGVAFSQFGDQVQSTGDFYWFCWRASGVSGSNFLGPLALPSSTWIGYLSGNRTASNAIAVYRAASSLAHGTLGSGVAAQTGTAFPTQAVAAFNANSNGSPALYSNQRISFLALHAGLSSAESALFYTRIAALRTALGGGNP